MIDYKPNECGGCDYWHFHYHRAYDELCDVKGQLQNAEQEIEEMKVQKVRDMAEAWRYGYATAETFFNQLHRQYLEGDMPWQEIARLHERLDKMEKELQEAEAILDSLDKENPE